MSGSSNLGLCYENGLTLGAVLALGKTGSGTGGSNSLEGSLGVTGCSNLNVSCVCAACAVVISFPTSLCTVRSLCVNVCKCVCVGINGDYNGSSNYFAVSIEVSLAVRIVTYVVFLGTGCSTGRSNSLEVRLICVLARIYELALGKTTYAYALGECMYDLLLEVTAMTLVPVVRSVLAVVG